MSQAVNPAPDSHMHIVKTTAQWNDRAIANWIVPRGCLCIELTTDYKTKLKIGEGNKYYSQLPYVGGDGGDLSNYYTKQEIDQIIKNLDYMSIKSINEYPSKETLPSTGNSQGDVRFVRNPDGNDPFTYLWNGNKWICVTGIVDVDLSEYCTKSEVYPRLQSLESVAHTHSNMNVLNQVTQSVVDDSHTHSNKAVLDQVTQEVVDDAHTHTNKAVLDQVTQPVVDWAHKHDNIVVLDATTASYTTEEKTKLASLENYDDFVGTDGEEDGVRGLVPAPTTEDVDTFLASDGTWKSVEHPDIPIATDETLGGVIVGDGLSITEEGVLSVDSVDVGVTDVQLSEETPGAITVTKNEFSYDIDPFAALGQIWFLCNNNPMVDPPTPPEPELTQPIGHTIPLYENGIVTNVMGHMTIPSS